MVSSLLVVLTLMSTMSPGSKVVKLPRPCLPEHYELKIDLSKSDNVVPGAEGNVQIRINCIADTNNITVNCKHLFISEDDLSVTAFDKGDLQLPRKLIKVKQMNYQPDTDSLIISLDQSLKKGSIYTLSINFTVIIGAELPGLYKQPISNPTEEPMTSLWLTNLYPMNARILFPCFDEPDLKATFNLSLVYNSSYNAVSNLKTVEERCLGYKHQEVSTCRKFSSQFPMAPYQLAFSINDYDVTDESYSDDLIIEGYTNGQFEVLTTAINYTVALLGDFHDLLSVQYPYEKLTLIAVAKEAWKMFGGVGFLGVPTVADNEQWLNWHLAKNLLRQILSDRLTVESWTDLWIVEGLTWYFSQEVLGDKCPKEINRCWEASSRTVLNSTFAFRTDFKVVSSVFEEVGQKAFCTFNDLANFIGKENFLRCTKSLIENSNHTPIDVETLANYCKNDKLRKNYLVEFFETRLAATEIPILNISRSGSTTSKYQASIGVFNQSNNCRALTVDFNETLVTLNCSKSISLNSTAIPTSLGNLFRVKILFDTSTYESLSNQLAKPNNLSTADRTRLIQDSLDFAWMGTINYTITLKLLTYLQNETEYRPWQAALYHFERIWYLLRGDSRRNDYEKFLGTLVSSVYKQLEVLRKSDKLSKELQKLHAWLSLWAFLLKLDSYSNFLRNLQKYDTNLPVHLIDALLTEAIDSTMEYNRSQPTAINQTILMEAFEDIAVTLILNPNIVNSFGRICAPTDFVFPRAPKDTLIGCLSTMSNSAKRAVVRSMAGRINTEDDYDVIRLVGKRLDSSTLINETVEIVQDNLNWIKKRKEEFVYAVQKIKNP